MVKGYNHFYNISFSRALLYEINIMNFFNTGRIFTPEVFALCTKCMGAETAWDILSDKYEIFIAFFNFKLHLA